MPSNGLPASKGQITRAELSDAGVEEKRLHPGISKNGYLRIRRVFRLLVKLPWLIIMSRRLSKKANYSKNDIGIVLATLVFERILDRNPNLIPVVNSDLSPAQVLLACAAQSKGRPSIWWQDDYHYSEAVPFKTAAGAILNRNGLGALTARNPGALAFRRIGSTAVSGPRDAPSFPAIIQSVGVAVNGLFSGSDTELATLAQIRRVFGDAIVELRLHPTSSLATLSLPDGVKFAPLDESVENFASRMHIVFCGNSAIQYKMVLAGTPVVHTPKLDPLKYDVYRYVDRNLVFGSEHVTAATADESIKFYASAEFKKRIEDDFKSQFDFDAFPLSDIKKLISGEAV